MSEQLGLTVIAKLRIFNDKNEIIVDHSFYNGDEIGEMISCGEPFRLNDESFVYKPVKNAIKAGPTKQTIKFYDHCRLSDGSGRMLVIQGYGLVDRGTWIEATPKNPSQ